MNTRRSAWLRRLVLAAIGAGLLGLALPATAAPAETPLTGYITAPRTLTVAESPYRVDGGLQIRAPVEIEPGVEIIFGADASLNVGAGGSLLKTSVGGAAVVFRGATRQPGWWRGIVAQPDSVALWLDSCDISDARTGVTAAAPVRTLKNCVLHGNQTGLAVIPHGATDQSLANLVLENNTGYALRYYLPPGMTARELYLAAAIPGLVVESNGSNAVQVDRSITDFGWQQASWPADLVLAPLQEAGGAFLPFDLPAVTLGDRQTLRILPGAVVRSNSIVAGSGATLLVQGNGAQPVHFVAPPSALIGWKGIRLEAGSSATLEQCDISGVQGAPGLAVASDAVVTRCTLRDNDGYGLLLNNAGIRPILDGLTITGNGRDAIAQGTADMQPRFTGLTVSGNGRDALRLLDGGIRGEVDLDSLVTAGGDRLPIIGGLGVGDGGYLRILPGTEIYMEAGDRLWVQAGGVLSATGALITGLVEEPGSWRGVTLDAGATALIEDSTLAYGGGDFGGVVTIFSSDVTLRNCRIHHGLSYGIHLRGNGSTQILEDLVIENNGGAAVMEYLAPGDPVYRGLHAQGNGQDGILLVGRSFQQDAHLERPGTAAGSAVLPYIVPELLNVAVSTTLTVEDGVVMQFTDPRNWGYLGVKGRLVANGVTFVGREQTPGSWAGIIIDKGGSADLRACQVLFAGDRTNNMGWRGIALRIETAEPVTLHHCTIRDSDGLAVSVPGPANVDLRWSNIHGNRWGVSGPSYVPPVSTLDSTQAAFNSAGPVDARYSWWGHASGPAHNPDNQDGRGDRVTGVVLFTPWATAPVVAPGYRLYLPCLLIGSP